MGWVRISAKICRSVCRMSSRELTPLGTLIEGARRDVLHISASEAARRARMSESRWRQVVTGVQVKGGTRIPVNPAPRVVIAMAAAVGADISEALAAAGLEHVSAESAAAILQELQQPAPAPRPEAGALVDEIERIKGLRGISPEDKIRMVRALIDLYEASGNDEDGR